MFVPVTDEESRALTVLAVCDRWFARADGAARKALRRYEGGLISCEAWAKREVRALAAKRALWEARAALARVRKTV